MVCHVCFFCVEYYTLVTHTYNIQFYSLNIMKAVTEGQNVPFPAHLCSRSSVSPVFLALLHSLISPHPSHWHCPVPSVSPH